MPLTPLSVSSRSFTSEPAGPATAGQPLLACSWLPLAGTPPATAPTPPTPVHLLGRVVYGDVAASPAAADAHIPLDLQGNPAWEECWTSATPVQQLASRPRLVARCNQQVLWGCASASLAAGEDTQTQARELYLSVFALLQQHGFAHLWRIWNFIPHINQPDVYGLETYRAFNLGRAEAFAQAQAQGLLTHAFLPAHMPAATGVGCGGNTLHVYFVAGRTPSQHIENPRQVPAWRYPPEHGPRPPSFARATHARLNHQPLLFISGTASIIGHQTVHVGDWAGQCRTTLENLRLMAQQGGSSLHALNHFKVYVRHAHQLADIQALLQAGLPPSAQVGYFVADICRKELLVEIEALRL